jgi:hypothetical protein
MMTHYCGVSTNNVCVIHAALKHGAFVLRFVALPSPGSSVIDVISHQLAAALRRDVPSKRPVWHTVLVAANTFLLCCH